MGGDATRERRREELLVNGQRNKLRGYEELICDWSASPEVDGPAANPAPPRRSGKMRAMTTRRQHYVWQKYLEPWTVKKGKAHQLWCLRRGATTPICTETKNVGVERDFYRLVDLQEGDIDFVRNIAFGPKTNPKLRELNEGWISQFDLFLRLRRAAKEHPKASEALLKALDQQMIEYQENAYSRMETGAVEHIAALGTGDVSFFEDTNQAVEFSYFLAHQYFRTKAIRNRIRDTFPERAHKDRFHRTWPIFRYIFATNIGYSIFADRKRFKLQVLSAAPNMEFITGDQPAVNTYGAFVPPNTPLDELELYYPVSPTRAVILSDHSIYRHGMTLEPFRMAYLNQIIELIAYEQLFAQSEESLKSIVSLFIGAPR